ncbi:MAG: ABC transporter permease [Chloroflexi bacterium]|nr:ABC transporter permease [Chloroflexota bacterium]
MFLSVGLLNAGVRLATPILLAALGGILSERSGVINIGLEGMMLIGAFAGVAGARAFGSPWAGLVVALAAGGLLALVHAFVCVTLGANQIVSGVAINLIALGLSGYLFRVMFGVTSEPVRVQPFTPAPIPGLSQIPIVGEVLFDQIPLVYLALLLVPALHWLLFRTTWGLQIRAVGEHPRAADTVGINVYRIRYLCVVASGMLAGAGGTVLSLGQLNFFMENMTGGRGFIALAALIFGRWNPWGTLVATLLFGLADPLQLRVQAFDLRIVPFHLLLMLPYVLSLLALAGFVGRSIAPAASGQPYLKDGE